MGLFIILYNSGVVWVHTCRKPLHIYNASVCCKETHSQESHGDAEWLLSAYVACPACSLCALSAAQEQTTMQDKCNTRCFLDAMHSSRMHLEEMEIVLRVILSSWIIWVVYLLVFTPISEGLQELLPVLVSLQCCWRHRAGEDLAVIGSHDSYLSDLSSSLPRSPIN